MAEEKLDEDLFTMEEEITFELADDTSKAILDALYDTKRENFWRIMQGKDSFTLKDTQGRAAEFIAIVRCKDCKYYHPSDNVEDITCEFGRRVGDGGYCSYGERKDEED